MNNVSVYQLFEILQEEYIVCELRVKIYPIVKHKEYWGGVAKMKKEKILDIAKRNLMPSIFDDKRIKEGFEKKVYKETGLPKFYYPNKSKEDQQKYWDLTNYFWKGSEVKYYIEGVFFVGNITSLDIQGEKIDVDTKGEVRTLGFDDVARIL